MCKIAFLWFFEAGKTLLNKLIPIWHHTLDKQMPVNWFEEEKLPENSTLPTTLDTPGETFPDIASTFFMALLLY